VRTRATQFRAQFETKFGGERLVTWFVTNHALALTDLVDEASADLPDVLFEHRLQVRGPVRWHTTEGPDGSHWLYADVPVKAWTDPRRDAERRATTPEEIS